MSMIYKGIVKERDNRKKTIYFIGCLMLLCIELLIPNYLYMVLTVIVCLAIFLKKEHVVSEEGIEIRYQLFGIKVSSKWTWEQVTAIRPNFKRAKPNILLEIAKDITIRAFVFKSEDARAVMELAKKMNEGIYVDDRTEEERNRARAQLDLEMTEARSRSKQGKKPTGNGTRKSKR